MRSEPTLECRASPIPIRNLLDCYGGPEMTGYGFRATAKTILDEVVGFGPDFIEHQLSDAVRGHNGRANYRTAYLMERRKMMQEWTDYMDRVKTNV